MKPSMRALVCGGRNFKHYEIVKKVLSDFHIVEICSGHAQGVDEDAERYAAEFKIPLAVFPAQWGSHGRSAGPIRNREMLAEFQPNAVFVFPGGRGTADMHKLAVKSPYVLFLIVVEEDGTYSLSEPLPINIKEWP